MAELLTKKGKIVECNILNESTHTYLIEYNGKVGQVKKDRIISLNELDEAVLEGFRDRVKGVFNKIKEFFGKFFLTKSTVKVSNDYVEDDDDDTAPEEDNKQDKKEEYEDIYHVTVADEKSGKVYQVSPPVQAAIAAAQGRNRTITAYYGPQSDYEFARELGVPIDRVPTESPDTTLQDEINTERKIMQESLSMRAPRRSAINEADAEANAKKYHYVPLQMAGNKTIGDNAVSGAEIKDKEMFAKNYTIKEAIEFIYEMYRAQRFKLEQAQSICLWGAPGIGKSNMKSAILQRIKQRYPDVRWIEINGRGNTDDLYMQVKTTVEFQGVSGDRRQKNAVALESIANLPMYNGNNLSKDEEIDNEFYANGGRWKDGKQVSQDNGGIIFIDEFSRSRQEMMATLMTLLSDQTIGGGMKLGNRWIVIAAANTKSQMRGLDDADNFFLDPAQQSRICNLNIVPSAEEWYEKYSSEFETITDANGKVYTFSKVEPEILEFVLGCENKKWFYNLQIVDKDEEEYVNQYASKAIPRTWNSVSYAIRTAIILYNEDHGTDFRTLTDFWNMKDASGKQVGKDMILERLQLKVGIPAAKAFMKWMDEKTFTNKDAELVWNTGKCSVTPTGVPQLLNTIIPALISFNPALRNIASNNAISIADIFDPDKLVNVMKYIFASVKGVGAVTGFAQCFGKFQQDCIRQLKGFKNASDEFKEFSNIVVNAEDKDLIHYFSYLGDQLNESGDDPVLLKKIVNFCQEYEKITNTNISNY